MAHAGRRRQRLHQLLVVGGEALGTLLVGQVQVAEHPVTDPDRYPQE
jgi:hypothetical protein